MNIWPGGIIRKLINLEIYLYLAMIAVVVMGCSDRTDPSFQQGLGLYKTYCIACHGVNGDGVLYSKSVLNQSDLVTGDPQKVIAVILYGREGTGVMPGWEKKLNDQEVAAVATYIRQAWSNQADPVTAVIVNKVRNTGNN